MNSSRLERGLPRGTADVNNGGPGRVDGERKSRLLGRPSGAILLDVQWPGEANLGLGIQDGGKSPDGELDLDREAGEERKGRHDGRSEALLEWNVAAETVTGGRGRVK